MTRTKLRAGLAGFGATLALCAATGITSGTANAAPGADGQRPQATIGANALASQSGPTTYEFRLSNFSATVANVCVNTDVDQVCSGVWPNGKSEVFQVKANSLDNWNCADRIADFGSTYSDPSVSFNRTNVKECYVDGALHATHIGTKAP